VKINGRGIERKRRGKQADEKSWNSKKE